MSAGVGYVNHELDDAVRIVRERHGVDFAGYKRDFLRRRIEHRARMRRCSTVRDYLRLLDSDPRETDELLRALRLKITTFFRDPRTWQVLEERYLPRLVELRAGERSLRAWSAGCATGQEAYSLAMALAEALGDRWREWDVVVFATNSDEATLRHASAGIYAARSLEGLQPSRLRRWTEPLEGGRRQIRGELRERVCFLPHDVRLEPPFKPVDLILCRNLIMFFDQDSQKRILVTLRRSLRPDGVLVLGSGEYVPAFLDAFEVLDEAHHIYRTDGRGASSWGRRWSCSVNHSRL